MGIKFFEDINENDLAGGKGLSLAKMYKNEFNVPNGYIILADVFEKFLIENNIKEEIISIINNCNINNEKEVAEISDKIRHLISRCELSENIKKEIMKNFEILGCNYVSVRSSAISEDGKEHAWAGQLESYLNVTKSNIIESIKNVWSSIFTPRAIFYKIKNDDKSEFNVSVIVQKMIQSDYSGIAFSVNPSNDNTDEIVIENIIGLGEAIVSGKVTPDTYIINKKDNILKNKEIRNQKNKLIKVNGTNRWCEVQESVSKIDDKKILELSLLVEKIEKFYGFYVDIEYAIEQNLIYILQCRPITTIKEKSLTEKIKKTGNWKFYVSRKFNWFVENTEIYSSMENYQKNVLGFELITLNYLCLNGDEYALDSDFEILCKKLDKYFENDEDFFEKFANKEFEIVNEVKDYLNYLGAIDAEKLSLEDLTNEFQKFNTLYIKSFIPGMTRPEDYLMDKLEKELIKEKFNENDIKFIFAKVTTCPNYYPLSYSEEPLDLLKIALQVKKEGNANLQEMIEEHLKKYSWIKRSCGNRRYIFYL